MSPLARLRDWRESSTAVRVAGKGRVGRRRGLGSSSRLRVRTTVDALRQYEERAAQERGGMDHRERNWHGPDLDRFDDYRDVAGVKVPFRSTSESALTGKQSFQVTEAKANPEISEKTFAVPEG